MPEEVAKGVHDHPVLKLGAVLGSGERDKRTIVLDPFMRADIVTAPASWDFDKSRKPFPNNMWGNNNYGDCEIAARCNSLLRLERIETYRTVPIVDQDAVDCYKMMTGCQSPGDANDSGLTTLDNLNQWRHGWTITKSWSSGHPPTDRVYKIGAYGQITIKNHSLIRLGTYLFHGIIVGADLPITVQDQFETNQVWDVVSGAGSDSDPGSWGGHCVFGKSYDPDHMKLLTWKKEVIVTNAWWDAYVMEAFCVIDDLDAWRKTHHALDVDGLVSAMENAGIRVQQ